MMYTLGGKLNRAILEFFYSDFWSEDDTWNVLETECYIESSDVRERQLNIWNLGICSAQARFCTYERVHTYSRGFGVFARAEMIFEWKDQAWCHRVPWIIKIWPIYINISFLALNIKKWRIDFFMNILFDNKSPLYLSCRIHSLY